MRTELSITIDSYNYSNKKGKPYMIGYDILYNVDTSKSFMKTMEKLAKKYMIKSRRNEFYYLIENIRYLLWGEFFDDMRIIDGILLDDDESNDFLDISIAELDEKYNISKKNIHLCVCGPGIGGGVGRSHGIEFFFHTNEKDIHHRPHIHCKYGEEEFRIDLISLAPLDSTFKSNKKTKLALKLVEKNQKGFIEYWNRVVVKGESIKFQMVY